MKMMYNLGEKASNFDRGEKRTTAQTTFHKLVDGRQSVDYVQEGRYKNSGFIGPAILGSVDPKTKRGSVALLGAESVYEMESGELASQQHVVRMKNMFK